ncbi:UPF0426 protein, chloroplastic [Melia azedarach]|uniref:UPF0426 protein, chloroplastic n=1 Tax=Melia azedarach TaxID=155640 RepID=A0ACC1XQL6_MELAZ|nr:UPF0426 protein, chloroplastic [Melia azedarach]
MALSLRNAPSCWLYRTKNPGQNKFPSSSPSGLLKGSSTLRLWNHNYKNRNELKACFSPIDEPILKEALKEPVAFVGGMFAGLLRLDLNDDPLKEWVTRTVEAAGITEEEIDAEGSKPEEEVPEQIEIE